MRVFEITRRDRDFCISIDFLRQYRQKFEESWDSGRILTKPIYYRSNSNVLPRREL